MIVIEGFKPSTSPTVCWSSRRSTSLGDIVLGLTEEIGSRPAAARAGRSSAIARASALLLNGTLNSPQGPTAPVDVVVLASTDNTISIRVTILTDDDLRDAAFSVVGLGPQLHPLADGRQ